LYGADASGGEFGGIMAKTHAWHCGPGQKQSKEGQTRSRRPDGAKLSQTFVEHGGESSEKGSLDI